jgi:NACHT domain
MKILSEKSKELIEQVANAIEYKGWKDAAEFLKILLPSYKTEPCPQPEDPWAGVYKKCLLSLCEEQEARWQQFPDDETYRLQDVSVTLSVVESEREAKGLAINSYEDLFKQCDGDQEKQCNHLVNEGDAGMGKSTYVC